MAGPLASVSMQPWLPQPQSGPSGRMQMWPSSPAAPSGPSRSLPSTATPPPMPVPSAKKAIVFAVRPWPKVSSPSVAMRTSLSR